MFNECYFPLCFHEGRKTVLSGVSWVLVLAARPPAAGPSQRASPLLMWDVRLLVGWCHCGFRLGPGRSKILGSYNIWETTPSPSHVAAACSQATALGGHLGSNTGPNLGMGPCPLPRLFGLVLDLACWRNVGQESTSHCWFPPPLWCRETASVLVYRDFLFLFLCWLCAYKYIWDL